MPDPTNQSQDAWQRIGLLLPLLQNAEHAINTSLRWVFTNDPFGDESADNLLDQLSNLKDFDRKRTLGQLHRALRERVQLGAEFEAFFTRFVDDRNRFSHRLFLEDGFNVNKPEDIPRIRQFVDALTHNTMTILAIFHAFLEVWAEEHDLTGDDERLERPEPFEAMVQHFKNHITQKA